MRVINLFALAGVCVAVGWSPSAELKTAQAVLERYQQALGGADAIGKVQSETRRGEVEGSAREARREIGIDSGHPGRSSRL
jgi:hypothetical protein